MSEREVSVEEEAWETIGRPGYFGRHRETRHQEYDGLYGPGNWRLAWQVGESFFTRQQMCMLYEDSYFYFLQQHPEHLEQLVREGAEVYDDQISNIQSGLDYTRQETERTHVQDIAIRRALTRLGRVFQGEELIQIRHADGTHPLSLILSPGRVPFHRPDWLLQPELEGWWSPGSVESFYQSNKLLQRRSG